MAESTPDVVTSTCTSTVPSAAVGLVDDLVALIDERSAIVEFDGGHDRETADRLAREMVLGRDAPAAPADDIVASADTLGLAARANPYVHQTLSRFSGTVRLLDDRDDPFAGRRPKQKQSRPGQCSCGHDSWVQVPVHGGRSTRVDCGHCDRFGWFSVWYGRSQPSPFDDQLTLPAPDVVQLLPPSPVDQVQVPVMAVT